MSDNSNNVFVEDIKLIADDLSGFFDELEGFSFSNLVQTIGNPINDTHS